MDGGRRAVIFDQLRGGVQQEVIGEGTHFRIPMIQQPRIIDVRARPRTIHSATGTKDLQMVNNYNDTGRSLDELRESNNM